MRVVIGDGFEGSEDGGFGCDIKFKLDDFCFGRGRVDGCFGGGEGGDGAGCDDYCGSGGAGEGEGDALGRVSIWYKPGEGRVGRGIYLSNPATCACYEDDFAGLGEFRTFRVNGGIDVAVDGAGESVVDGEAMRRG